MDDPRIPLDSNASERAGRGPAVARKNFYGSGSLWSGPLAAAMFSLLATLARWKIINPKSEIPSLPATHYAVPTAPPFALSNFPKTIRPALVWRTLVTRMPTVLPICSRPASTTTIVPSAR